MVVIATDARAGELSDGGKSVIWNVEHNVYMTNCTPGETPKNIDDDYVSKCEYGLGQEDTNLKRRLTVDDRKLPAAVAALAKHEKNAAHVAKMKAKYEESRNAGAAEAEAYSAHRQEAKKHLAALSFLQQLEQGKVVGDPDLETNVKRVADLKEFADRCVSTYSKIKKTFGGEFEDDPKVTCPLAQGRDEIMKRGLPKLFAKMRAKLVEHSNEALEKLNQGHDLWDSTLECAKDAKTCNTTEAQIARVSSALGIAPTPGPAPTPGFAAALQKASSQRRVGTFHDASREGLVVSALKKAGVSYLATGLVTGGDEIKKTDLGIPTHRRREARVLVQTKGEPFCRAYTVVITAPYTGGGTYGAMTVLEVPVIAKDAFLVSSCK